MNNFEKVQCLIQVSHINMTECIGAAATLATTAVCTPGAQKAKKWGRPPGILQVLESVWPLLWSFESGEKFQEGKSG